MKTREKKKQVKEKTEKLIDISVELNARLNTNDCANNDLLNFGWIELCEYAIRLLNEIKS